MTTRKPAADSLPRTLREALYELVHRSPVPAKVQAEELGISYSYLCNAANLNLEGEGFDYQLRQLLPHTRLTGNVVVMDFLERSLGRVAMRLPAAAPPPLAEVVLALGRASQEFGELVEAVGAAVRDGRIDAAEYARLQQEGWELIRKTVLLLESARPAGVRT